MCQLVTLTTYLASLKYILAIAVGVGVDFPVDFAERHVGLKSWRHF